MKENPDLRHRRSLCLKDYDYFQAGMYFITLCTQNHQWLFGEIKGETMYFNAAREVIEKWYWELSNKFPDIQCDEYIIMSNHIHFIIHKVDQNKSDQQKMNNPCRGGPMCPPNQCLPIIDPPIMHLSQTDEMNTVIMDENIMEIEKMGENNLKNDFNIDNVEKSTVRTNNRGRHAGLPLQ